jgi:integration host factor subunit beta
MIRSELIAKLHEENRHLTHEDATKVVDAIFETIVNALSAGQRVELRGFGAFTAKSYEPRAGRNPRTGELVDVPAKRRVYFKRGKRLFDRMNEPAL